MCSIADEAVIAALSGAAVALSADADELICDQTTANSRQCGQSSAVCHLGLEGIVSKKMNAPYRSGPSRVWIKVKNPKSPAATRAADGTF